MTATRIGPEPNRLLEVNTLMRRSACLLGICFLLIWGGFSQAFLWAANPSQAPLNPSPTIPLGDSPTINISESIYDFGEVMEDGEIVHEFTFTNTGKAPLEITQVRPG